MGRITITEFEGVRADSIPPSVLKSLLRIKGFYVRNGMLIPHSIAGYMVVEDVHIIVKSRLKEKDFSRILVNSGFPSHLLEKGFESIEAFQELADTYLTRLKQTLVSSGAPRDLQDSTIESSIVKGKVRRVYPHRIEQKVWKSKPSPVANILLEAARQAYEIHPSRENHYLLGEIEKLMEGKAEENPEVEIPVHTVPEQFRDVFLLAKMLLQNRSFMVEHGEGPSFHFLINTALLFENYVKNLLETDFTVDYQKTLEIGPISIRPDFMINGFPADAKYKFRIERDDLYQAIAYSTLLKRKKSFLLYPYHSEKINISCCKIIAVGVLVHDALEKLKKEVQDA